MDRSITAPLTTNPFEAGKTNQGRLVQAHDVNTCPCERCDQYWACVNMSYARKGKNYDPRQRLQ